MQPGASAGQGQQDKEDREGFRMKEDTRRNCFTHRYPSQIVFTGFSVEAMVGTAIQGKRGVQESLPHLIPNTLFVVTDISKR